MKTKTNVKAGQLITVSIEHLQQNNYSEVYQANVFQVSVGPSGG